GEKLRRFRWRDPRQAGQRQSQAEGGIAGDQKDVLPAQHPQSGLPLRAVLANAALQRQHVAGGSLQSTLEDAPDALALARVFEAIVDGIDVDRQLPFALEVVERILERRVYVSGIDAEPRRKRFREAPCIDRTV